MARPLIAVSAPIEELDTAFGVQDCTKLRTAYTDPVYTAGGRPVILPVLSRPPADLLEDIDGLLLTGGGDIAPALYGEQPHPGVYGVRPERDAFEAALLREALARRLPVLALCRGMQLVNVLRGGTLNQHVTGHWQQAPASEVAHDITVAEGSLLADAVNGARTLAVNSYHHQAVRELGADLRVSAVCGDVIEAIEATDADLLAVQWHSEQLSTTHAEHRALFSSFVRRAKHARTTV